MNDKTRPAPGTGKPVRIRGEALFGPFPSDSGPGLAPPEELEFADDRLRRLDRMTRLCLRGAERALADAGLSRDDPLRADAGIYLGNAYGAYEANLDHQRRILEEGGRAASPAVFTNTLANVSAGWISIVEGLKGAMMTFAGGFLACAEALIQATSDLEARGSGLLLVGGAHAFHEDVHRVLTRARTGSAPPVRESAPFLVLEAGNGEREGVVLEGSALARGPSVHDALEGALSGARCRPDSIDAVLCAGDATTDAEVVSTLKEAGYGEIHSLVDRFGDLGEATPATGAVLSCRWLKGFWAPATEAPPVRRLLVAGADPCGRRAFAMILSRRPRTRGIQLK